MAPLPKALFTEKMVLRRLPASDSRKKSARGFRVPPGVRAYLLGAAGEKDAVAHAGQTVRGAHDVLLARDEPLVFTFSLRLPTADQNLRAKIICDLEFELDHADAESRRSLLEAFPGEQVVFADALRMRMESDVRGALSAYVAGLSPGALHRVDHAGRADPQLVEEFRGLLFSLGVRFRCCRRWASTVPGIRAAARGKPEAGKKAPPKRSSGGKGPAAREKTKTVLPARVARIIEKDARGEQLERREVREVARALEHGERVGKMRRDAERARAALDYQKVWNEYEQSRHSLRGALERMEAETRVEIDRMKLEAALDMAARVREVYADDTLEFYLSRIKDDRARAQVLSRLLARDLTPEQIRALAEVESKASTPRQPRIRGPLFVLCKDALLRALPGRGAEPLLEVERRWNLGAEALGPLRSLSPAPFGDGVLLALGARRGAYLVNPASNAVDAYEIPGSRDLKSGVNSAALSGRFLYVAHAEAGLLRWRKARPAERPMPLLSRITEQAGHVRGLCRFESRLFFAADRAVYSFGCRKPEDSPDKHGAGGSIITAMAVSDGWLLAGNRRGELLALDARRMGGLELVSREPGAIRAITPLEAKAPGFLVTARERWVMWLSPRTHERVYFHAPEDIRAAAFVSPCVLGLSGSGKSMYVWRRDHPERPAAVISLPRAALAVVVAGQGR